MNTVTQTLSDLVQNVVAFVIMIVLAIIGFYFTVFVVSTGANLAGYDPSGDFVVLSASLLVVAAILAGGASPVSYLARPVADEEHGDAAPADD